MIKAIVFDCFGVLIDDYLKARIDALDKTDPEKSQQIHDVLKAVNRGMMTRDESTRQFAEILGVEPEELLKSMMQGHVKNTDLTAFIRPLRSKYKIAMLSNVRGRERLDELFDLGELDELFDVVVASGDVGMIKPEPGIYELTAEKLGVIPEECVMIDDLPTYCKGAEDVGMQVIQFHSTKQAISDLEALIDRENQTD